MPSYRCPNPIGETESTTIIFAFVWMLHYVFVCRLTENEIHHGIFDKIGKQNLFLAPLVAYPSYQ